jgi:circadian clock protein KaiC
MNDSDRSSDARLGTGLPGLDEITRGGLIPRRTYLIRGGPGSGKTTLGAQILCGGSAERALFVTLGETAAQLRDNAKRGGLSLDAVPILDLSPAEDTNASPEAYSLLESWEVEGHAIHDRVIAHVREHRPERVFIDSLSQLRYLTPDTFQFRKQVLSLLAQLTAAGATVVATAERGVGTDDEDLAFLVDGVIELRQIDGGRTCAVTKMRGSGFAEGAHHYALGSGGMVVYPRLDPGDHGKDFVQESIGSGIEGLDALTHGGIERGTVTVLSGPSGVGKTSIGAHFMQEAARRGEHSVIYSFEERRSTFVHRLGQIGIPVSDLLEQGNLAFEYIEPLHYNPDRFALLVREAVERDGVRVVMLDSLSGYRQSVHGEDMVGRVHALCRYLVNMGVTVIIVNEARSVSGAEMAATEDGLSYLADSIILLRYVESDGALHKTISVLKKRTSDFEKTLRNFDFTPAGVEIGAPARGLHEPLKGVADMGDSAGVARDDR